MNLADLRRTLGVDSDGLGCSSGAGHEADDDGLCGGADSKARQRRLSMERMDILKVCFVRLCLHIFFIYLLIYLFIYFICFLHDLISSAWLCYFQFLLSLFGWFGLAYRFHFPVDARREATACSDWTSTTARG